MPEMEVNYIAVLTASLFSFILGTFWYSPLLFGRQWQTALNKPVNETRLKVMIPIYFLTLILWLAACYILANIINFSGANTLGNGMIIGFLCWLGFTAAMSLMHNMFESRPITVWLVNSGYTLLSFLVSGAIFGVWK